MIELRPHHILCFQSYIGKGYSSDFTDNMDYIVSKLRENPKEELCLVDGLDHICINYVGSILAMYEENPAGAGFCM